MNDWTSGYVADIEYTYGYYAELNPLRSRLALLKSGIACPEYGTACELGFGQGLATNVHASASNCDWYGTDFNPSQAGFAQELAQVSGNSAQLFDQSFEDFCSRSDLPDFDFIGIHGIWSWISVENRNIIVDFIKRKLKVGGVVFISYNTFPGWANFAPVRKLMTQHAEVIGSEGSGIVNRIEGALEFADELLKTNPQYLAANPVITERLSKLKTQDRHYLAHEYFNRDWNPMHFSDMAEALESAKVDYACSANYLLHLDALNFTDEQMKFLNDIPDAMLQQSVRDFMHNTQFRQDYWVKGPRKIPNLDQLQMIREEKVMLSVFKSEISLKFDCIRGEANLNKGIYEALLEVLGDYEIHTIGEITDRTAAKGLSLAQVLECILTLAHRNQVVSVVKGPVAESTIESCNKLNAYLMNLSRSSSVQSHLASPVIAGGVNISRIEQLFISAYIRGQKSAEGMAAFVWEILNSQDQKLVKEGKALQTDKENVQRLREVGYDFLQKRLKILQNLMIMPKD